MSKYEQIIEQLNRENKRLQSSLKDMVGANRILRDQNKKQANEIEEKTILVDNQNIQIKQVYQNNG